MTSVRWASVATVAGAVVLALVCLAAAARGRVWAWVPGIIAASVALREVRALQRGVR